MTGRALKRAETVDGALVPALTAWDRKVLNAVPVSPCWDDKGWSPAGRGLDPWLIARAVREDDVRAIRATLNGLSDRHLVRAVSYPGRRTFQRWVRSPDALPDPSASGSSTVAPSQRPEGALTIEPDGGE